MHSDVIAYDADGLAMQSRLFFQPAAQPRAGVLVFPESFGLNEHTMSRARRLAGMGYVALACDVHGDGLLIPDLTEASSRLRPIYADTTRMRARARAALNALARRKEVDPSRIASIGYCLGGTMSLELARSGAAIAVDGDSAKNRTAPSLQTLEMSARGEYMKILR